MIRKSMIDHAVLSSHVRLQTSQKEAYAKGKAEAHSAMYEMGLKDGKKMGQAELIARLTSEDFQRTIANNLMFLFYKDIPKGSGDYTLGQKIQSFKYAKGIITAIKKASESASPRQGVPSSGGGGELPKNAPEKPTKKKED